MSSYDLIVLGGGAAGLAAARAARWEGASVALISDAPLGGDCTFTGCVPSKTLIEASRQGLSFEQALTRVASVVERIASTENGEVLRREGADVIEGRGRFVGPRRIEVDGRTLSARRVILATGSRPAIPAIDGLDNVPFRTNEQFFEHRSRPDSLVVVGGGPAGCELAEAMSRFGTTVSIVEYLPRLLARYEPDASALVAASLRDRGIDLLLNARAKEIHHGTNGFQLRLAEQSIDATEVLVATGRHPNTEGLGLDRAAVDVDDRGYVVVDRYLRTSAKGVYAAGDCNGVQLLSHAADEMGRVAAWTALRAGRRYRYDADRIPHAVFTTPEVAAIGVVEADAPANARVAEISMDANDRALAADRVEGFVRLIARPDMVTRHRAGGKVVGATIVGERAGELINEVALVMRANAFAGRLAQTVRAYPTWSTVVQKAAARWFYPYEGVQARPPRRAEPM